MLVHTAVDRWLVRKVSFAGFVDTSPQQRWLILLASRSAHNAAEKDSTALGAGS
jgi:hypothetical protein